MANYQIIRRLEIIIHLLQGYPGISKRDILQRLFDDYDVEITSRTLERDFSALSTDLGIEVLYDRSKNGYGLHEGDRLKIEKFLRFAGHIYLGDIFKEALDEFNSLAEAVKLQDSADFTGLEWFQPILLAIRNRLQVSFLHENYQKETQSPYKITPFHLREYQGRWYVVGLPEEEDQPKTFGLDRISELKTEGLSPANVADYEAHLKRFDSIIGLNYGAAAVKTIIELAVSPEQYKYLKTLPLHQSQKKEGLMEDGRVRLSLFLYPNFELKMELLRLGPQVEVLNPPILRAALKRSLEESLKLYQD